MTREQRLDQLEKRNKRLSLPLRIGLLISRRQNPLLPKANDLPLDQLSHVLLTQLGQQKGGHGAVSMAARIRTGTEGCPVAGTGGPSSLQAMPATTRQAATA
jgi:hypothetical protein